MPTADSGLSQSIVSELSSLRTDIEKEIALRQKARKTVMTLVSALEADDADTATRILSTNAQALLAVYPRVTSTLEKLRLDLGRRQEELVRETCARLEEYCAAQSIPCTGRAPEYVIDGLLQLAFDRVKLRTKVGVQSLNSLAWDNVRQALESERARLWDRPFDAGEFRDRLLGAYSHLERASLNPGGWAPLDALYQAMRHYHESANAETKQGRRLIAYYKDEFSADLSRLWEAQSSGRLAPIHVELSAIRDPRRAFSVIQPDNRVGLYGFLRPRGK